jgi:hypothetical protein
MPGLSKKEKPVSLLLRVSPSILHRIDRVVNLRIVQIPRHTWILEALAAKLQDEEQNYSFGAERGSGPPR